LNWNLEEKTAYLKKYSILLIKSDCRPGDANDSELPRNSHLVQVEIDGEMYYDIVQANARVKIFDAYYDKFGLPGITKITYTEGKVNPKTWGYKPPEKKKR
jgi:hypothetical protein